MRDLNIAMLGSGLMAKAHSNAWRQVRHFFPGKLAPRMKVICGRDRERTEAAARQYGWEETATDWRKVVERRDIDVIDICTTNDLHPEQAIAAAKAGKHILCEKPLANSLAEAKAMLRAAEKAGVIHMAMFNYRRVPAVAYAKKLIENGRLGRIYHYRGAYLQEGLVDPGFPLLWRMRKERAGTGCLGDTGSHAADLALYLNGDIEAVTAMMATFIKRRPLPGPGKRRMGRVTVDDEADFLARFRNGSAGVFEISRFCGGRKNSNIFEIYGAQGSLRFNIERLNEIEFYDRAGDAAERGFRTIDVLENAHPYGGIWWPTGHSIGWEHTFTHAIHEFLTALEGGRMAPSNFHDAVKVQGVLEAIQKSARSGKWEKVP